MCTFKVGRARRERSFRLGKHCPTIVSLTIQTIMANKMTAIEAKYEAQKIAFAPIYFHAVASLKELGILEAIGRKRGGRTLDELAEETGVSRYGVQVLLEAGACINVVSLDEEGRYTLTAVGIFLRSDRMTEVNMNFSKDVCYAGFEHLTESIRTGKPSGLKVFGDWPTVYEGLSKLPPKVKQSWLEFDHFYSDDAFPAALDILFRQPVYHLYDIGGNTGKWSRACCGYKENVEVTILDLPGQLALAERNNAEMPFSDRIHYHAINLLDPAQAIPEGADTIWMSQFLDCFSPEEITSILSRVHAAATPETNVYILEPFWNNQRFPAGEFCLVGTSLYFTCIANGNSKMYHSEEMERLTMDTGFDLVERHELIGNSYHTLLHLRKRA